MSKEAAHKGKSESKVNQALVEKFIKEHQGKLIVEANPAPPESGPVTYVIAGVHDSKTMGLRADNGGGKFGMVLLKKQGDDTSEPRQMNPNLILDLLAGREAKGLELGHASPFQTSAVGGTVTTTTDGGETKTEATKVDGPTEDPEKVKAAADKKAAAEAKKAAAEAKAAEREKARKDKEAKETAEKEAREAKKAQKAKNSGKFRALRVFREEPTTVPEGTTHRSRVMAKFRASESEGGLGMSTQHANTYYQNCKGIWAGDVLPEDEKTTPAAE